MGSEFEVFSQAKRFLLTSNKVLVLEVSEETSGFFRSCQKNEIHGKDGTGSLLFIGFF